MADDGVDDLVGATGVGEQFGEHRAERDQHTYPGRGRAESIGEGFENITDVHPRDDADGEAAENQRQERVQLRHRNQDDDERNACECGEHQLPARRDGLSQLGIGRQDGECRGHFVSCSVVRGADRARYASMIESMSWSTSMVTPRSSAPRGSSVANWEASRDAGMKWPGRLACRLPITSGEPARGRKTRSGRCRLYFCRQL